MPDDLEVANSDFLVHCILEGFNKGKIMNNQANKLRNLMSQNGTKNPKTLIL